MTFVPKRRGSDSVFLSTQILCNRGGISGAGCSTEPVDLRKKAPIEIKCGKLRRLVKFIGNRILMGLSQPGYKPISVDSATPNIGWLDKAS